MKIESNAISSLPRLYTQNRDNNQANNELKLETGFALPGHDSVEISEAAKRLAEGVSSRELPVGAIKHHSIRPFFTAEIDTSLEQLLKGKAPEVEEAVNYLISSNFVPDGSVADESKRAALLESGLSQAKFIADNYMTKGEAAEFLATMDKIAAYAKTRTVDPETGQASYIDIPRKPDGAPDDYVNFDSLMKKYDPESANKLAEIVTDMANGGSGEGFMEILLDFNQKLIKNPQWSRNYRTEINDVNSVLNNTKIDNRFAGADTSNMAAFLEDMNSKFQNTSFENKDFLTRNIEYFALILGKQI
ncbi:hypothetical protein NYE69_14915 [Paenibacillus sp. FSL R5-0527]|uniref:hypothetical protein n=1 Tax=Paenibacillus TaxID=44249 RepID=UPI00097B0BFD|nr:hypothetical protein [Paenibacillus macerans]OMG50597.1 hypothetical protein BK140_04330 [Paenibacillus macerans]